MASTYTRCKYISVEGLECETWYPYAENNKFCEIHRTIPSASNGVSDEQKQSYIDKANQDRALVAGMTFEEIDAHIARLQSQMEELKRQVLQARAVKADRIDKLTEDERRALRSQTISRELQQEPTKRKPKTREEKIAQTLKTNTGVAADFLTMDVDELMKKYKKAKDEL